MNSSNTVPGKDRLRHDDLPHVVAHGVEAQPGACMFIIFREETRIRSLMLIIRWGT
jgi:hypothetical protein